MRILFYDTVGMRYHALSTESIPLGGSESAACYLARSLARMGHHVILMTKLDAPGIYDGVQCIPHAFHRQVPWSDVDVVVWMGPPVTVEQVKAVAPRARLIFWTQHATDQPGVQFLRDPAGWRMFDALAMVSEWQRSEFARAFGIPVERMAVMRNAVGFPFESLFAPSEAIVACKSKPPVLAYTSTPFRGLDALLEAFPLVRAAVPGVRLKVFSSMRVYQTSVDEESALFGLLYQRCVQTQGVEYVGSLPQRQLAEAMREVAVLSYPNTFPETSCIAVMEAMASGCRVVTTDLGALAETTAGFASLVRPDPQPERCMADFIGKTLTAVLDFLGSGERLEQSLRKQVEWIQQNATWRARAIQWTHWFVELQSKSPL